MALITGLKAPNCPCDESRGFSKPKNQLGPGNCAVYNKFMACLTNCVTPEDIALKKDKFPKTINCPDPATTTQPSTMNPEKALNNTGTSLHTNSNYLMGVRLGQAIGLVAFVNIILY
uniref:Uncharacterized protein n=1 Tax=Ditylenchus dipsaci TaxID=166011 RepID=A0A915ESD3_9BILA